MGLNAQTTVPTFTSGQVLTADQQNQSARTGVPVFATTADRDAAFGGAGEKTLAEGQLAYIEATNVVQYYDGAAWATVGPQTVSSGLTLISTTTIGSAVASVTVTGAFSSTYDNYRIIISGGVASTTSTLNLTLGATNTGYYWAGIFTSANWGSTLTTASASNTTSWYLLDNSTNALNGIVDVMMPNLAKNTWMNMQSGRVGTNGYMSYYAGLLNDTTQYTAFTLTASTGTVTGGTVKVYGYQN